MKLSIKKIIIICLLFIGSNVCFAAEGIELQMGNDYLITSDKNMSTTLVANPDILAISPFFTIFNEKNVLLIHPQKVGKTSFTIFIGKDDNVFNVTIIPQKSTPDNRTIEKGDFEIMLLDAPPTFNKFDLDDTNKNEKGTK